MRRVILLIALLVLGATLVAPAAASPQPTPVCRFCGGLFEAAAADAGVNATVASSDVRIDVRTDRSATWTVTLELTNGTEAFATSPGRLEPTARALVTDTRGLPREATYVDASLEGDTVTLQYRVADAAERHAGLLVVDLLHDRGGEPRYHVNADRFVVSGPSGTVVANDPDSGQVTDGTVVWRGDGGSDWYGGTALEGSPYVVFGPDRSTVTRLQAASAIALATGPIVVRGVSQFILLQTALFAVLLGAVVAAFGRCAPRPRVVSLASVLVVLGVFAAAVPAAMNGPRWVTGPPLLAVGLGVVAFNPAGRERLRTLRAQTLAVAGLLLGTFAVVLGIQVATASEWTDPVAYSLNATVIALPLAAMVPLGGALAVRPDRIRPWFALTVLAFIAVPVTVVDLADPPAGLGGGIAAVGLLVAAVALPLLGMLCLALGGSLGAPDRRTR